MANNDCTPHNAAAKLAGVMDAGGIELTEGALNVLDDNGKMLYHAIRNKGGSETLSYHTATQDVDDVVTGIIESHDELTTMQAIRSNVMHAMKPADFLPQDVTEPVFNFLNDFYAKNHGNMNAARGQYFGSIKQLIKEVQPAVDKLEPAAKGEAAHWMRDLREGYPFYGQGKTFIGGMVSNSVKNVLDFSGTVFLGNPIEFIVKAPSVYGIRPTFDGLIELTKTTKGNYWAKIPELEELGVYGYEPPAKASNAIKAAYGKLADGAMAVSDRPFKNWAYATGKAKAGSKEGGLEAVEQIMFKNRFGNDPRIARKNADAVTLMNYTLNTYHMLGGMARGLAVHGKRAESARQLAMWTALTAGIGGPAALIPAPLSALFGNIDGYKEWEAANINTAGKLMRPGGITFGVGYELVSRAMDAWNRGLKHGIDKLEDGDTTGALLDFGDAGVSLSTVLWRSPFGNVRAQRAGRNTRDLFEGDVDNEGYWQKNAEIVLPALKQ